MIALPVEFEEKMKKILKEEYPAFRAGYEEPRRFGLRLNRAKITPEEFRQKAPFHLTPIPWIDNGFYYREEDQPSRHPYYFGGLYYLQEPSAMTPANLLPIRKGERVLDLCAAPGGKTTELGARLFGTGFLAANDISASRARALLKNVEIFGIPNSLLLNEVPSKLAKVFPEFFHKILVDAPCSGEGMFRKDPDTAKAWSPSKPLECAKIQREIVLQAANMLKPGGSLLYSTCTFSPEENEQTVAFLLKERPDFRVVSVSPYYEGFSEGIPELAKECGLSKERLATLRNCIRIWPHKMGGEGHFLALLKREGEEETLAVPSLQKTKMNKELAPFWEFSKDLRKELDPSRMELRKGQLYYVPRESEGVRGLAFLRNGLYLGELKKGRFEPSQAFAASLGKGDFRHILNLSAEDDRVYRYLKGETLEVQDGESTRSKGWVLVCVDGFPLGWGKLVNGLLKNKYLASWRMGN